jgi:hypothetical protein
MKTRTFVYKCTRCGREVGKENLRSRVVSFREIGRNGAQIMSRTTDWLCVVPFSESQPGCLYQDPDYKREALVTAPGLADTKIYKAL